MQFCPFCRLRNPCIWSMCTLNFAPTHLMQPASIRFVRESKFLEFFLILWVLQKVCHDNTRRTTRDTSCNQYIDFPGSILVMKTLGLPPKLLFQVLGGPLIVSIEERNGPYPSSQPRGNLHSQHSVPATIFLWPLAVSFEETSLCSSSPTNFVFPMVCWQSQDMWSIPSPYGLDRQSSLPILQSSLRNYCSHSHGLPRHNCILQCSWYLLWYSGEWNTREYPLDHASRCLYLAWAWVHCLVIHMELLTLFFVNSSKNVKVHLTQLHNLTKKMQAAKWLVIPHQCIPHCGAKCPHSAL
jgi:hypothetical protein